MQPAAARRRPLPPVAARCRPSRPSPPAARLLPHRTACLCVPPATATATAAHRCPPPPTAAHRRPPRGGRLVTFNTIKTKKGWVWAGSCLAVFGLMQTYYVGSAILHKSRRIKALEEVKKY